MLKAVLKTKKYTHLMKSEIDSDDDKNEKKNKRLRES